MCCDMIDDGVFVGAAHYWTVASLILLPWNDLASVDKGVRYYKLISQGLPCVDSVEVCHESKLQ